MGRGRHLSGARSVQKLGDLGLLGLTKPTAVGGADLDYSYAVAMAEALGACRCGAVPMSIGVQTDMAIPALARFVTDRRSSRRRRSPATWWRASACRNRAPARRSTDRAQGRGDYVINGGKLWITNGAQAGCAARLDLEGGPHRNKSLIVVPMRRRASVERTIRKLGMLAPTRRRFISTTCAYHNVTGSATRA